MRDSVQLGRVAGVRVGLNWSLLIVAVLLGIGLAGSSLPSSRAEWLPASMERGPTRSRSAPGPDRPRARRDWARTRASSSREENGLGR